MSKWDFENDARSYDRALAKSERGLKAARARLEELLDSWPTFLDSYFLNRVTLSKHENEQGLTGEVLGKAFTVEFSNICGQDSDYIELVLWVPAIASGDRVELGRLLITPNGSVLDSSKDEVLSWQDDIQSFKLLVAILRKVSSEPATL